MSHLSPKRNKENQSAPTGQPLPRLDVSSDVQHRKGREKHRGSWRDRIEPNNASVSAASQQGSCYGFKGASVVYTEVSYKLIINSLIPFELLHLTNRGDSDRETQDFVEHPLQPPGRKESCTLGLENASWPRPPSYIFTPPIGDIFSWGGKAKC